MIPKLEHKRFVNGLIAVLSCAISAHRIDDAQALLAAVRVLRPRLPQLDGLEASIAAQGGRWRDAIRLLDDLERDAPDWEVGRSMRAYCLWAAGDDRWQAAAEELLATSRDADTASFMNRLLAVAGSPAADASAAAGPAAPLAHFLAA